jgi:hypothetical protein
MLLDVAKIRLTSAFSFCTGALVFIKMYHAISVPGALMDAPPEPLAHCFTASRTLKILPDDDLPKYTHSPPADMFLAKKFTLTPAMKWGVTALGSGLLGILAGFVLGSLLEVGRQT